MINARKKKQLSVLLLLVFLNQLLFPTAVMAMSGDGVQPEFSRFVPFDSSKMVDPFTGDFTYNIPLLNVPGPNGGYPINIAYSSGIQADQEASWVGLGWTLNPGVINRQTRGIPDDFDGDQKVVKTKYMKPIRTTIVGVGAAASEILGFDMDKIINSASLNLNISINNYTGYQFGLGLGFSRAVAGTATGSKVAEQNVQIDTTGKSYIPADKPFRLKSEYEEQSKMFDIPTTQQVVKDLSSNLINTTVGSIAAGALFANPSQRTNEIDFPKSTVGFNFNGKLGGDVIGIAIDLAFNAAYRSTYYRKNVLEMDAFGYLHSGEGLSVIKDQPVLMDFYRSKEAPLNQYTKYLPVPVATNDLFVATGHTLSGAFRPQTGNVQLFEESKIEATSGSTGSGIEYNQTTSNSVQIGVNRQASGSYFRSGYWSSGKADIDPFLEKNYPRDGEFEPYAFAELGTLTPFEWDDSPLMDNYNAQVFKLDKDFTGISRKAKALNSLIPGGTGIRSSISSTNLDRTKRMPREQNFKYWTGRDIRKYLYTNGTSNYTYTYINETNGNLPEDRTIVYEDNSLIQRIEIENTNGKHVYGIPVYTHLQDNRMMSFNPSRSSKNDALNGSVPQNAIVGEYVSGEDGSGNASGRTHLFESDKFDSKFPNSYLLTEILSSNYVDVDNNGPSEADLGSYTLFRYKRQYNHFVTYSPPRKNKSTLVGHYSANSLADEKDDMCSYTVNDGEQYYLEKIETKTHQAIFTSEVVSRDDDYGYDVASSSKKYRLQLVKIELYKKVEGSSSNGILLKTVSFTYHPTLGAMHSTSSLNSKSGSKGKLLLKEITIKSGDHDTKVVLNPYKFEYHDISGHTYTPLQRDAWGYYQPEACNEFGSNSQFPGVNQSGDYPTMGSTVDREKIASVYNLKRIELPTGGHLEINYEQDDYQYVQDEKARTLYEIAGFGSLNNFDLNSNEVFLKLKTPVTTQSEMEELVKRIVPRGEYIYMKAPVVLKKKPLTSNIEPQWVHTEGGNDYLVDYIEGYVKVSNVGFTDASCGGACNYEYIKVTLESKKLSKLSSTHINPIRYAAFFHLFSSPMLVMDAINFDLTLSPSKSSEINAAVNGILKAAKSAANTKGVFFVEAKALNYASKLAPNGKGVIALNAQNGRKYGGGIRVSSIVLKDRWSSFTSGSEASFDILQEYKYELADGTSSGVAEYEPLTIKGENPIHKPLYFAESDPVLNRVSLMVEGPLMEDLYPAPRVGYSRVVVSKRPITTSGLPIENYSRSSNGIQVIEHYTAKDFPTIETRANIIKENVSSSDDFTSFIGLKSYFHPGYSQGYALELNNMHGKQKKVSTYGANVDVNVVKPSSSVEYEYHTTVHEKSKKPMLKSEVQVLEGDGKPVSKEMGVNMQAYVDMQQDEVKTVGGDIAADLEVLNFPPAVVIPIPVAIPAVDNYHALTRKIVTAKVITRNGILKKVITQTDGKVVEAENLLYDAENCKVLLSKVTNDFNAPIYAYSRPLHWQHDQLKGSYKNTFALVDEDNFAEVLAPGDVIARLSDQTQYRVREVSGILGRAFLETSSGTQLTEYFTSNTYIVVNSGHKNDLGSMYAQMTSLKDPTNSANRNFELFEAATDLVSPFALTTSWQELTNCDGDKIVFCFSDNPSGECVMVRYILEEGIYSVEFAYSSNLTQVARIYNYPGAEISNFPVYTFQKVGNMAELTKGATTLQLAWQDPNNLFPECIDAGVLNASYVTLSRADALLGSERFMQLPQNTSLTTTQVFSDFPAFFGLKNSYYPRYSLNYFAQRNQSEAGSPTAGFFKTDVAQDGTYSNYIDYNPQAPPSLNAPWVVANEFTLFDFFGNSLEQANALGIHQAQIMDKDNVQILAKGMNVKHNELCFQGFEGYATGAGVVLKDGNFSVSGVAVVSTAAHTGSKAASVDVNDQLLFTGLEANKTYRLSLWSQRGDLTLNSVLRKPDAKNVDGWYLYRINYISNGSGAITVTFNQTDLVDDIALCPLKASITAFVYDAADLKLLAQFDDQHFATIYGYDDELNLSFVKKETEKGIHTLTNYMTNKAQ
jgi:hypothetical protein